MQANQNPLFEDLKSIMKEGWLEKESRFFKSWRRRWFVLTQTSLYSFKSEKQYRDPTEVISLKSITTIKSCDEETKREHSFKIDIPDNTFYMVGSSNQDKEQWIGAIGKAMVKMNIKNKQLDDDD